jgi:hypothetical protein
MLNPLEQWSPGESLESSKLNREVEVMNQIASFLGGAGIDVMRTLGGTTATPTQQPSRSATVLVLIGTAKTPGGLYAGYIVTEFTPSATSGQLDPTSAETNLESLFSVSSPDSCYFINIPEYGLTTHAITDVDNEGSMYGIGVATGIPTTDGLTVVVGISFPFQSCT